ncbi:MAG: hypothetical protein Kow0062_15160 [Acidobacteriota bacterium]
MRFPVLSPAAPRGRVAVTLLAFALVAAVLVPVQAGSSSRRQRGDLAVVRLVVHEVAGPSGPARAFLRLDVKNVSATPREDPFDVVVVAGEKLDRVYGRCRADGLAPGESVRCDVFLDVPLTKVGDRFAARLDRRAFRLDRWDRRRRNDQRIAAAPDPGRAGAVRIAEFEVLPRVLRGMGEVTFRYTVEHGHLVWILAEGEPARLLGGHPADGLLAGQGRLKIRDSGPVTLVARDRDGRFVYRTVPVTNTYRPHRAWAPESGDDRGAIIAARPLEAGAGEAPVDPVVLEVLERRIAALGWAPEGSPDPFAPRKPARKENVLNPAGR